MSDATLARMEHGKYVGVRGEPRRDGVCVLRKPTPYTYVNVVMRGVLYRAHAAIIGLYMQQCTNAASSMQVAFSYKRGAGAFRAIRGFVTRTTLIS